MNEVASFTHSFKKDAVPPKQNPRVPVRCWSEKDVLNKKIIDAYVIILRTQGCSWSLSSGCTMCGYFNDSLLTPVSGADIQAQFEKAMEKYKGEPLVKIFTSGSFFDPKEIPIAVQHTIIQRLSEHTQKISVESRPEYLTEKKVTQIKSIIKSTSFEVGIGLETSNDLIRRNAINKGFTFQSYKKAARLLRQHQVDIKTYVLLKPPFLTEREALNDCLQTARDVTPYSDVISLNPTNVQRHTVVEFLWKRDQYRPAWLWSILEILRRADLSDVHMKCDVVGGGNSRGAHNCGTCDRTVLSAISQFSLYQKKNVFQNLACECQEKWRDQLDFENLSFGSYPDFGRWAK